MFSWEYCQSLLYLILAMIPYKGRPLWLLIWEVKFLIWNEHCQGSFFLSCFRALYSPVLPALACWCWGAEDFGDSSAQTMAIKGCIHWGGWSLLLLQLKEVFQRKQWQQQKNICPKHKWIKVSSITFSIQGGEMFCKSSVDFLIW